MLQASYVVARGVFDPWFYSEAVAVTLLLPLANVTLAWLCDECIDLLCDTLSASAWEGIAGFSEQTSSSVKNKRAQFVYMTAGQGERPIMLRFRAALAAVLAALLVPIQKNVPTSNAAAAGGSKNVEPLFRVPTILIVATDLIFVCFAQLFRVKL